MIKKLLFVAGAGVGYVLGTRAGRERYNALVSKARKVADRPEVQEMTQARQIRGEPPVRRGPPARSGKDPARAVDHPGHSYG